MEFVLENLGWLAVVLGIVARIFVPWLAKRYQEPDNPENGWAWKFVWPQLLAVLINLLVLPLTVSDMTVVAGMNYQVGFLAGWGAADIGAEFYARATNGKEAKG